jgi:hypothetical protein
VQHARKEGLLPEDELAAEKDAVGEALQDGRGQFAGLLDDVE